MFGQGEKTHLRTHRRKPGLAEDAWKGQVFRRLGWFENQEVFWIYRVYFSYPRVGNKKWMFGLKCVKTQNDEF